MALEQIYDMTSLQVADLESRDAIHPLTMFRVERDWLLVEVEEGHWRLAHRWSEIKPPFYSALRWEFSRGYKDKGTDDRRAAWTRDEILRVEGIWFECQRQRPARTVPVAA